MDSSMLATLIAATFPELEPVIVLQLATDMLQSEIVDPALDAAEVQAQLSTFVQRMAREYLWINGWERSYILTRALLTYHEANTGRASMATTDCMLDVAVSALVIGQRAEGEALVREALALREAQFGPDAQEISPCLRVLQSFYQAARDADAEEAVLLRELAINEATLGPEDLNTKICRNNLKILEMSRPMYAQPEPPPVAPPAPKRLKGFWRRLAGRNQA